MPRPRALEPAYRLGRWPLSAFGRRVCECLSLAKGGGSPTATTKTFHHNYGVQAGGRASSESLFKLRRADPRKMETEPAFGTQKRAADRDACTQDHSTATKMLQLLPMLRPHQTGSLSCEARLALLIDAWVKQAGAQHELASSDRAQLASVLRTVQPRSKSHHGHGCFGWQHHDGRRASGCCSGTAHLCA